MIQGVRKSETQLSPKSTVALELAHMKLKDSDKRKSKQRERSFIEVSWEKWEIKGETLESERG